MSKAALATVLGVDFRDQPVGRKNRHGLGLQYNEHLTEPGDVVFRHACAMGPGGDRLEADRLALPIGTLAGLDQIQESGCADGEA